MSEQELTLGAVVELRQDQAGQYTATQKQLAQGTPPGEVEGRKAIEWGFGPVQVAGYVDVTNLELGVNVYVAGISLGNLYGQLQDGVGVKVDLLVVKGEIKFYLKNGNELWAYLDISIKFDGSYNGDYKITSF